MGIYNENMENEIPFIIYHLHLLNNGEIDTELNKSLG